MRPKHTLILVTKTVPHQPAPFMRGTCGPLERIGASREERGEKENNFAPACRQAPILREEHVLKSGHPARCSFYPHQIKISRIFYPDSSQEWDEMCDETKCSTGRNVFSLQSSCPRKESSRMCVTGTLFGVSLQGEVCLRNRRVCHRKPHPDTSWRGEQALHFLVLCSLCP